MKTPRPITVDFETDKIESRPVYPPKPVGVSIRLPGKKARYYAFGHPIENNCSKEDAMRALRTAYEQGAAGDGLLFHNGKFDHDVAQTHMGLGDFVIDPLKLHDTQFLLFLLDPHAFNLGLKPSAERWLDMPPDEQDAVANWLMEHQKQLKADGLVPPNVRITTGNFGAYICAAPGKLVGKLSLIHI